MIGTRLYIFGGYGGHGQRRQFFDDLHVLDLELNTWLGQDQGFEAIREGGLKTEGTCPGPRGNHTTSVVEKTFNDHTAIGGFICIPPTQHNHVTNKRRIIKYDANKIGDPECDENFLIQMQNFYTTEKSINVRNG